MNQMPKDALWQARVLEGDTLGAVLYPKPDEQRKGFPSEEWYDVITKLCQELRNTSWVKSAASCLLPTFKNTYLYN